MTARCSKRIPTEGEENHATTMRAAVFQGKGKIALRVVPRPVPGVGQALIKVTLAPICGTNVHILKGEYPVKEGLIVGHEPVGVIEELGPGVSGIKKGDRVLVGAITPFEEIDAYVGACSTTSFSFTAQRFWPSRGKRWQPERPPDRPKPRQRRASLYSWTSSWPS